MMVRSSARCFLFLIITLWLMSLTECSSTNVSDLRVASQPTAFSLPIFVADAKGYFRDEGFKTQITNYNSQNAATTAILSGNVDVSELGTTIFSLEENSPGKVQLLYGQYSGGHCLIVPTKSNIHSLTDLKGKRIGTWPSSTAAVYLHLLLDTKIGSKSFTVVSLESQFLNQAMAHGDVDVLFESDVYAEQAVQSGQGRYLSRSAMEEYVQPHFFNGGGIISSALAKKDPHTKERLLRVFARAIDFINEHPEESRAILAKQLGYPVEIASKAPFDHFVKLTDLDVDAVQSTANKLQEAGLLKTRLNVRNLF